MFVCFLYLYKNVFKNNNEFSQTKISERSYSKLDNVDNLINIFNAKSYNIENPSSKDELITKEVNAESISDDMVSSSKGK